MTAYVHGTSLSITEITIIVLWLVGLKCAALDLSDLEKVLGDAVRDALMLARITEENAADMVQMDVSSFRKALRGERHMQLGLARLMRLPFVFWLHFSPTLMYLVAKKNVTEIAESLGVRTSA